MDKLMKLDKQAHFLAGTTICLSFALFVSPILGLITAIVLGAVKELWDGMGHGTKDIWDFVATALGGVVGFVLILISEVLK
jgi:Flp pilus assembly pilin Flp